MFGDRTSKRGTLNRHSINVIFFLSDFFIFVYIYVGAHHLCASQEEQRDSKPRNQYRAG